MAVFDSRNMAYEMGGRLVDLDCAAAPGPINKARNALLRVFRISRLIRSEQPDKIISFMESANFPALLACMFSGNLNRLTISIHTNPIRIPVYHQRLFRLLYRWPAVVVAISAGVKEALTVKYGIKRCINIPNPIDPLQIQSEMKQDLPAGIPGDRFILAVGSLRKAKGFDLLIKAYAQISPKVTATLVILGEGPDRKELEELIRAHDLEGRVLLPGGVPNPFTYMHKATLFVLSSRWEGWGNVLMEAMACGCPVVAFDCPYGPGEMIEHEISGLLVTANDIDGLSKAIKKLLTDDDLRRKLGENGRKTSRKYYISNLAPLWLASLPLQSKT